MSAAAQTALKAGVERVTAESGGAMNLDIVRLVDLPDLMFHALAGDAAAAGLMGCVQQAVAGIQNAPRRRPMLCASCPRPLRNGRFAIVVATPLLDKPTAGLGMAICTRCGVEVEDIRTKALTALRRIWPDARPFTMTDIQGGTA